MLCGDRDEKINHIIRECSILAQKEHKTWHGGEDNQEGAVQKWLIWT